jgi:hypothetical protein
MVQFGTTFLHFICHEVEEMQGGVQLDDWWVTLEGSGFDHKLGIGCGIIESDDLPSCLIWIHVGDIFLHGPTRAKYMSALKKILDLTVRVGLIYHPTKLKPPAQIHKLCGFVYDSETILKLRVPANKIMRALALLGLLMRGSRTILCRLSLSVVVGTPQYLVPSTQHAIGTSFIHHVYRNIHNETLENSAEGSPGKMGVEVEVKLKVKVEVEVVAVEILNGWTQEPELSLRWNPGWELGMGLCTASPPTGENP